MSDDKPLRYRLIWRGGNVNLNIRRDPNVMQDWGNFMKMSCWIVGTYEYGASKMYPVDRYAPPHISIYPGATYDRWQGDIQGREFTIEQILN